MMIPYDVGYWLSAKHSGLLNAPASSYYLRSALILFPESFIAKASTGEGLDKYLKMNKGAGGWITQFFSVCLICYNFASVLCF